MVSVVNTDLALLYTYEYQSLPTQSTLSHLGEAAVQHYSGSAAVSCSRLALVFP